MLACLRGELGFLNNPILKVPRNLYLPSSLYERVCFSNHLFVVNNNRKSIHGGGIALDENKSNIAALGEYLERYASSFQLKKSLIFGAYEELKSTHFCFPPNQIHYYSEKQYEALTFQFKRLTPQTKTHWIQGENYCTQEKTLLPFFMVNVENIEGDGLYHKNTSTGTACHITRDKAIESGLLECIERDGFATFWYFQKQRKYKKYAQSFIVEQYKTDNQIKGLFENTRIKIVTYDISEYAYCSTFVVFILFKKRGKTYKSVGSAARLNKKEALLKATLEAYQGIEYTEFACEQNQTAFTEKKIADFDFSEVDSFKKHYALYNLFPELTLYVPLLKDVESEEGYTTSWQDFYRHHIVNLQPEELVKKGINEVYVVLLSTIDTLQLGFEVLKVCTPQLNLLTGDFNYPYLGLFDSDEDLFTDFPHPFP
ncbi:YcaO-like family protein [Myroides odoratus]|uniref:YcaO-like family protein n=1 Tax=Myroides odoratus TaxID=256 RepID=UPI0039B0D542